MKFFLFAAAAAALANAGGLLNFHIGLEEYTADSDCYLDDAYVCITLRQSGKTMRDMWSCWANAPSKCWYRVDVDWTVDVPQKGICKTPDNDWVIDFAGYRAPFMRHAYSFENFNFRYTGSYHSSCDPWLYLSSFKGPAPLSTTNLGSCEIQPVNELETVPVWYMQSQTANWNYVTGSGTDFITSHLGQLVLRGIDENCYGSLIGCDNDLNFAHYSMWWGMKGSYETTTTPAPSTTAAPTTKVTTTTSFIAKNPVEFCQYYIYSWDQFPVDHCAQLCEYYYVGGGGAFWCPGSDTDPTGGEVLLNCVMIMNKAVCFDSRDKDSTFALPAEAEYIADKDAIETCKAQVASVENENPFTQFCKGQCEYYATVDGSKRCVETNPSASDLVECVTTRNDFSCYAPTH